jgi:ATP-dependent DNA helicase RecQ
MERLRAWRREVSAAQGVPAYIVFHDRTLAEIAGRRPGSLAELAEVPGVGAAKLERYGEQVLSVLRG